MKKMSFITAGAALAIFGMGIAGVFAQNNNADMNSDDEVMVVETEGFTAETVPASDTMPNLSDDNTWNDNQAVRNGRENMKAAPQKLDEQRRNITDNVNNANNVATPDNQPTVDKAMKNQNPNYNNGNSVN